MEWNRYNPDTFEYDHKVTCQPNPARPGEFLIPPSATPKEPPEAGHGGVAVFDPDREEWVVHADYRGTEYWLPDGTHHKIETIGETPPDNALYEQNPDLNALALSNGYARQERIKQQQAEKARQELLQYKHIVDQLNRQQKGA